MNLYDYQQAFGAADRTSRPMRKAVKDWFGLYYQQQPEQGSDPCQRVAYTVVNKLMKTVFSEYRVSSDHPFVRQVIDRLNEVKKEALQLALVGGECYIKPLPTRDGFRFTVMPRDNALIFARDARGEILDMGTVEKSTLGKFYYTLLERRTVDEKGYLTITNRLYRSYTDTQLGQEVALIEHPLYAELPQRYTYELPVGSVGLVRMRTPMVNCVDGSAEGVSVYAAAVGLIRNIDRNEALLSGEFERGQSRIVVSKDLLDSEQKLGHNLFVGLDDDPEHLGLTVFAPQLREQSFLARKQEYLRNVETVIGLQRGMLSDANMQDRTATEITASEAEHNLTVIHFQQMWQEALHKTVALCAVLGRLYGLPGAADSQVSVDWGNGVLYDEDKLWQTYREMVSDRLLRPEIALGWRFNLPVQTEEDLQAIRKKLMPSTGQPAVAGE